jgi:AcrR family transcriptional regulator
VVRRPALHSRIATGILDTAAGVLAERGESASMAEIATAAGVGRATLYRYFPTRDALLRGLISAAFADLRERVADAQVDTVPVAEGIARLTRGFMAAGSKYAALARADKDRIRETDDVDRHVGAPIRDLLRRGVDDGTLRGDLSVDVLFEMFTGLLERSLNLVLRHEIGVEQAAAAVTSVFLDGAVRKP